MLISCSNKVLLRNLNKNERFFLLLSTRFKEIKKEMNNEFFNILEKFFHLASSRTL